MESITRRASWLVAATVATVAVVASGTSAAVRAPAAKPKPRVGGTVLFGADQEPRHLNDFVEGGDHLWAAAAHYPTMAGVFTITPRFAYKNDLVSTVRFRRKGDRMVIRYRINPKARWNDGVPITAEDFRFTWQMIMSPRYRDVMLSTVGYEDMRDVTGGKGKVVTVTFKRIYAGWRDLFGEILPAHALSGLDFASIWKSDIDNPKTGSRSPAAPSY